MNNVKDPIIALKIKLFGNSWKEKIYSNNIDYKKTIYFCSALKAALLTRLFALFSCVRYLVDCAQAPRGPPISHGSSRSQGLWPAGSRDAADRVVTMGGPDTANRSGLASVGSGRKQCEYIYWFFFAIIHLTLLEHYTSHE